LAEFVDRCYKKLTVACPDQTHALAESFVNLGVLSGHTHLRLLAGIVTLIKIHVVSDVVPREEYLATNLPILRTSSA
jgi:hypothetical protein